MMKTVIIDDDLQFAERLKNELVKYDFMEFDIEINNDDDEFDLYFLDIDMPEVDGIAYAKNIKMKFPHARIVFVSYRSDLIFDAIHVFPFSFIRKEYFKEELLAVLDRIRELEMQEEKVLSIHDQLSIPLDHICYIEKKGSYAYVNTENHVYKLRKSLNTLFDFLNRHFVYINKGTIINLCYVDSYQNDEIRLINGTILYLSRGRRNEFRLSYLKYKEGI